MLTLEELKEELKPYVNTLVLDDTNVVRLVDGYLDFYWVFDSKSGIYQSSCVGGWVALKGYIPDDEYNRLVTFWNRNHIIKAE